MPRAQRNTRSSAKNEDWTDREILGVIITRCAVDADGYASSTEIGIQMGFSMNGQKHKSPATKVGSRLAYMRDMDLLESAPPDLSIPWSEPGARDTRWRPTQKGRERYEGKLSKPVLNAMERLAPGAQIQMMDRLSLLGWVEGDDTTATMMRRQWEHNRARRKVRIR